MVMWLCAPPPARYLGLTPYLHTVERNGSTYTVFASLADSASAGTSSQESGAVAFSRLNSSAGGVQRGDFSRTTMPFGAEVAVLMSPSPAAMRAVAALLTPLLQPTTHKTLFPVPGKQWSPSSTYSLLQRVAMPYDTAAWAAWIAAPPVAAWLVTPKLPEKLRSLPLYPPPLLIDKEGFDESYLKLALDVLSVSIKQLFAAAGSAVSLTDNAVADPRQSGKACIDLLINCGGDNRDTTYVLARPSFQLPADATSMAIIVGVNHQKTGNGVYSNLAVYDSAAHLGLVAVTDALLVLNSRILDNTPYASSAASLYAVVLTRDCAAVQLPPLLASITCLQVPTSGWPRAPAAHWLSVLERPYAALDTSVGPAPSALVGPQVILVNVPAVRNAAANWTSMSLEARIQGMKAGLNSMRLITP